MKYDFLIRGIDEEDIAFLKRSYEDLLKDDNPQTYWLNDTHWVDHSETLIPDPQPPKKRRKYMQHDLPAPHKTGGFQSAVQIKKKALSYISRYTFLEPEKALNEMSSYFQDVQEPKATTK